MKAPRTREVFTFLERKVNELLDGDPVSPNHAAMKIMNALVECYDAGFTSGVDYALKAERATAEET